MKQKIIVLQGMQASGKSTFAKEFIKQNKKFVRINNDSLRLSFFDRQFDRDDSKHIDFIRNIVEDGFLANGMSLVIDNMNLSEKHINRYMKLAELYKCELEFKDFRDVPLQICIERDSKREHPIGKKVITETYNKFIRKEPPKIEYDPKIENAIWLDLDGTCAIHDLKVRTPYQDHLAGQDKVNEPVKRTVKLFHDSGAKVIVCSGRDHGRSFEVSKKWLIDNDIPFDKIFLRPSGDTRPDTIIKKEIYEREIKGKYNILTCLDDRSCVVSMLRELGLPVFQVNEGDF